MCYISRSVICFWMVFCASAAATHWLSEKGSSVRMLMRYVAVLKNMEQMKHWPRRGRLGEKKCFHWFVRHFHNSASHLCSVMSSYHVNSLEVQLNSKSVYGEVREKALQGFGKNLPHPLFCTWSITRKDTRSGSRGIQLVISEVWEQQTVEWMSTDGLRSLVIWYASLSGYKALRLSSYSMVQQK